MPTRAVQRDEVGLLTRDSLGSLTLATATVDRLLHHAHIVVTDGDSYRLVQATSGKGVTALN